MIRHRLVMRIIVVLGGLLCGLLLLELGLQIGAWYLEATGRELPLSWVTGNYRILCLGDSNTYGLWLEREEAYPAQLEDLWNRTDGLPKSEVLNMGFPGTNSSKLRSQIPEMLDTFRPDLVIVMVGVNDFWTARVPLEEENSLGNRFRWFVQTHSRVYKLFYMIRRKFGRAELEVVRHSPETKPGDTALPTGVGAARYGNKNFELGWKTAQPGTLGPLTWKRLEDNLAAISSKAREFGSRIIFMTYASRFKTYPEANKMIRRAAARTGTPLIDLTAVFESLCPEEECPQFLFEDHHPKARGYGLIAETIVKSCAASGFLENFPS